jgi:hypothetical protein
VLRLGALTALAPPPDMLVPPPFELKMVLRLLVDAAGSACFGAAGGGGTENRARSCSSVSRIRLVISWFWSNAFVKIFGGANLGRVQSYTWRKSGERTATLQLTPRKARFALDEHLTAS